MSVVQNSGNVNSLFNQAIGRSTEPDIDPEVKAYVDDAIADAVETITAAYTAAISTALSDYIPLPSSAENGDYLVYDGTSWDADTLPVYDGGVTSG